MNNLSKFQKLLASLLACLLVFTIFSSFSNIGKNVSGQAYSFFTIAKYTLLEGPILKVGSIIDDFENLWRVHSENEELKKQLADTRFNAFAYAESERQLAELKALLGINERYENYDALNANIISRDPSLWNNYLTIDVGSNQGVEVGQAVISSLGLIGKVSEVAADSSTIKLLTNTDGSHKLSVKIIYDEDQSVDAVLESYNVSNKSFVVRLFSNNNDIKVGDKLVTSGMGGVYPPGIDVGEINEIVNLNNQLGKRIYVTPAANFQDFQFVSVLSEVSDVD